jgi:hypothetical protein
MRNTTSNNSTVKKSNEIQMISKIKVTELLDVGNSNIIFDSFYCIKKHYIRLRSIYPSKYYYIDFISN